MLAIAIILTTVALVALCIAWRGQRVGAELRCARCEHQLDAATIAAGRCPECGLVIAGYRSVVHGRRFRRTWIGIVGAITLIGAGATWYQFLSGNSWLAIAPTVWLARVEYPLSTDTRKAEIVATLLDRDASGSLDPAILVAIARDGLALQQSLVDGTAGTRVWAPIWGEAIVTAIGRGIMTPDEAERAVLASIDLSIRVRPPLVARCVRLTFNASTVRGVASASSGSSARGIPFTLPSLEATTTDLRIGGLSIAVGGSASTQRSLGPGTLSWGPTSLATGLDPGTYDGTVTIVLTCGSTSRRETLPFSVDVTDDVPTLRIDEVMVGLAQRIALQSVTIDNGVVTIKGDATDGLVDIPNAPELVTTKGRARLVSAGSTSTDRVVSHWEWTFNLTERDSLPEGPIVFWLGWISIRSPGIDGFEGVDTTDTTLVLQRPTASP